MSLKHSGYSFLLRAVTVFAVAFMLVSCAAAESPDAFVASAMRLLRYEGTVEIFGTDGEPRTLPDDACFASGESLRTGENSKAWISLDEGRNLVLDADTHVVFIQEGNDMRLILRQGLLLLDVQKKLAENEKLEIELPDMTVHIRGTLVFAQSVPDGSISLENSKMLANTLAVLEGTAEVNYQDTSGARRLMPVHAGEKVVLSPSKPEAGNSDPVLSRITSPDIAGFVAETVIADPALKDRVINGSENGEALLNGALIDDTVEEEPYPADGDWTISKPVSIVAQSASKLYDGKPLTRSSGAQVSGLPGEFSISVTCNGSRTDAGTRENTVYSYVICNASGENVTSHFTEIQTVPGSLRVDPAPLIITGGSAQKVYDGKPLTCPDYTVNGLIGNETVSVTTNGTITNPGVADNPVIVTWGSAKKDNYELSERAGTLTVLGPAITLTASDAEKVYDGTPLTSLAVTVSGLPEGFRVQTTVSGSRTDAGTGTAAISAYSISDASGEDVTSLFTNVSLVDGTLTVDPALLTIVSASDEKTYDGTPLTKNAFTVSGLVNGETVTATATGSQTDAGTSENTFTVAWDTAKEANYTLEKEYGTLTVKPAPLTISSDSDEKTYDGTALTKNSFTVTGLVNGETVTAAASGSQKDAGSSENAFTVTWGTAKEANYTLTKEYGKLTVKPAPLTVTSASDEKAYDGTALTNDTVTFSGLADGETVTPTVSGSQKDAGTSENAFTVTWGTAKEANYTLTKEYGTLTVKPAPLTASSASAEKTYDGTALTNNTVTFTGLVNGETATAAASGSQTDAGESENAFTLNWGTAKEANYTLTKEYGTLTVKPAPLTITSASDEKTYDGTALTNNTVTFTGLVNGETATAAASGSQTDAGESENAFTVTWGTAKEANYTLTKEYGTLTVKPAPLTASSDSAEKTYDGTALTNDTVTFSGLADGETVTAAASGSQTDAGESENAFTVAWGTAKESNYYLKKEYGKLTVKPAPLTIASASDEKTYDGTALTNNTVTFTGLVNGETVTAAVSGTQTNAGTSENSFTVTWDNAKESNYAVTENPGTLKVNKATLVFNCGGGTYEYLSAPAVGAVSASLNGNPLMGGDVSETPTSNTYSFSLIGNDSAALTIPYFNTGSEPSDDPYPVNQTSTVSSDNYAVSYTNTTVKITPRLQ